jgi:hypothetical protein
MRIWLLLLLVIAGCSPRARSSVQPSGSGAAAAPARPPSTKSTKVVKEGNTTTITTTTTTWVDAPAPPPRPADPWPADPLVKYNVDKLNEYRLAAGVPALLYDAPVSAFALEGSKQLAIDHEPHAHFAANVKGAPGFGTRSAENQGDWNGIPKLDADPRANGRKQVDVMLKLMIDEGPGGGHHDNMLSPKYRRVGVGLFTSGGKLYLTNDFTN